MIGTEAVFGAATIISLTVVTEHRSRAAAKTAMDSSAHRQVLANSAHQNAEVIRALGMTGRLTERWLNANERYLRQNLEVANVYANIGALAKVVRYILQSAILGLVPIS